MPAASVAGRPTRRAAVIGADGFIGRHLIAALATDGIATIGYTRRHELDWPVDPAHRPDTLFYLASSITPTTAEQYPQRVTADHLRFAALLARVARDPRPPVVVLTSSGGTVYDPDAAGPCRETDPTRAAGRYGQAKVALEELLRGYAGAVPAVILRLSNVYGPGQRTGKGLGVLAYWLQAAATGAQLRLIGEPSTTRDFVHVDDVVECMRRLAVQAPPIPSGSPLVLNIASGVSTSLANLLATVQRVVGRQLPVIHLPARTVDRRESALDVRCAAEVLGWRARTTLRSGIATTWQALLRDTA